VHAHFTADSYLPAHAVSLAWLLLPHKLYWSLSKLLHSTKTYQQTTGGYRLDDL